LARSYNQYCKRMKANQAITRIAKKLLSRIRYVLKNKQPYVLGVIK
jgi:transposase